MSNDEFLMHYVSTLSEAKKLIENNDLFLISNCGCREGKGNICNRSKIDVCLQFKNFPSSGSGSLREISKEEALDLVDLAKKNKLVARPFKDLENKVDTVGICFCCDDCCGYFLNPEEEKCEKGKYIESTNREDCTDCGLCVGICYFKARKMVKDKLVLFPENCYGCGLCQEVCPTNCIDMVLK